MSTVVFFKISDTASPLFSPLLQFVCVESLVTAMVDMYPKTFRRKNRRELFILAVAIVSFLMGLIMLTEVGHSPQCHPGPRLVHGRW